MTFILTALALAYLWAFIKTISSQLPDWFIHLILLPALAYGLTFVPLLGLTVMAACGIVYLIESLTNKPALAAKDTRIRRTSNIPPPP